MPAGVVRRPARAPLWPLAPHLHGVAARDPERVTVAAPVLADPAEQARLDADLAAAGIDQRHDVVEVDAPDVLELFARHGLEIVSMGRPAADDPALFQAGAAAGSLAASYVDG